MNIVRPPSKRKRIEALVKKSIETIALTNGDRMQYDQSISDAVEHFVKEAPIMYFNMADDRKSAGQVLAYMMEISEINDQDVNADGYRLITLMAETDLQRFRKNTPRTFEKLQRRSKAAPEPTSLKRV